MKNKNQKSAGIINMMELTLNQRKFTTSEIGRGIGIESSKKTYNRKEKHKSANDHKDDSWH